MSSPERGFLLPTNLRSPSAREFWRRLAQDELLGRRCAGCGESFFPPRALCPQCLGDDLEWLVLSGRGTLHSWTEIHIASPEFETPFLLGLVDLEGGIGRLSAEIVDVEAQKLEIGMPMRIAFRKTEDDQALYCITVM